MLFLSFLTAYAQAEEPVSAGFLNKAAIGRHSPMAYHQQMLAIKGSKEHVYRWKGAEWYFATAAERDIFAAEPTGYAPTYNGFCANALSLGEGLVKTNGVHWRIIDERLYLFYSAAGRKRWTTNTDAYIREATKAWHEELNKWN